MFSIQDFQRIFWLQKAFKGAHANLKNTFKKYLFKRFPESQRSIIYLLKVFCLLKTFKRSPRSSSFLEGLHFIIGVLISTSLLPMKFFCLKKTFSLSSEYLQNLFYLKKTFTLSKGRFPIGQFGRYIISIQYLKRCSDFQKVSAYKIFSVWKIHFLCPR